MVRNKIQIVLIILLLNITCFLTVLIAGAYLTSQDEAENTFTAGNNKSVIVEDYEEVTELDPGDNIRKAVTVANTGKNSCYIRVLSLFSDKDAEKYAQINYNREDWELKDDGYYYYRYPVAAGESTTELFSRVKIASDFKKEEIKGFEMLIYAESVNVEAGGFS